MSILPKSNLPLDSWFINVNATAEKLLSNPLIQKNVWYTVDDLGARINQHSKNLTINFNSIHQDWLRLLVKLYVLVRSQRSISASGLRHDVHFIGQFSKFIQEKSVFNPDFINDKLLDEFEYHLYSLKLSQGSMNGCYCTLKNFFNHCREEGWLKVNTYWFKGKVKRSKPKNDEIEYIPEEVWQQLDEHLHHLPDPIQRKILIIRGTGLRIGELLNLPLDCLRQRGEQWRLRLLTEKYQTVDEIPICEELVAVIKEQQEYIRQNFEDSYNNLFTSNNSVGNSKYIPAPRVMAINSFNRYLNELARKQNICTNKGQVWHFKSHQFRRTVATVMTNAGVRDLIIQKYLRHRSPDMQNHYKHLFKKVLGKEYQDLMKGSDYVNSTGELVAAHKPKDLMTELIRRKMHQITTQYGECHRPILKSSCETVNACWRCEHWLTSTEDLSMLKRDICRVESELDIASRAGMIRQQQGLAMDRQNLVIRIEVLEKINGRN